MKRLANPILSCSAESVLRPYEQVLCEQEDLTPASVRTEIRDVRKIDLLPRQMEAASVFHIECPEYLAVREIHPKGDRVSFSWHLKRVTAAPNHGMCWVRRGSIWELSD
jgi:hypothetical protein